jgi:hypothetical protein
MGKLLFLSAGSLSTILRVDALPPAGAWDARRIFVEDNVAQEYSGEVQG